MQLLVDGWDLHPGPARRGIGRFLDGLLPALASRGGVDVRVLQRPGPDSELHVPPGTSGVPCHRLAPRGRIRLGTVEHLLRLPWDLDRVPHDVLLSPGTIPPRASPRPWVQTLHDLAPLTLPHRDYAFARQQWRLLGPRLRRATRVVAVSRFTADEAIDLLDVEPGRVVVVPHGVGPPFVPDGPVVGGSPYLLSVCTPDPRKGLREAAAVASRLRDLGVRHELRIAGALPSEHRRRLDAAPGVRTLGFVDDLPAWLRGADAVLVTSRYEGFGFTALEAMACGTPVVAFDNTAIGEVVADAGSLIADGDVEGMAHAVRDLLSDDRAQDELRRAGLARADELTWSRAADRYERILREAAVG